MLAWIFWHLRSPDVDARDYGTRLQAFLARIAEAAPDGCLGSSVLSYSALPWLPSPVEVFEPGVLPREPAAALPNARPGALVLEALRVLDMTAMSSEETEDMR